MNEQNMINVPTETGTEDVNITHSPKMTKEKVQQKTNEELLQMIQQSQGHTGKDFSDYMNCDFSYTYLTGLIRDRGYENGWYKTSEGISPVAKPDVIIMKKSDESAVRKSFMLDDNVAEEWKAFNKNIPFPSVTISAALRRFMDDYKSGKIKFELEL